MTFRNRVIEHQNGYAEICKILGQAWVALQRYKIFPEEWMENILEEDLNDEMEIDYYDQNLLRYKFSSERFHANTVTLTGIHGYEDDISFEIPYEAFDSIDLWAAKKLDEQKAALQVFRAKNEAKKLADNEENEKREREFYEKLKEKFESCEKQ